MYEKSKTNLNMYRYQGPPKPFRTIISNANPTTATNRSFVKVLSSISSNPTLDRGCELFITDLVSGPATLKFIKQATF